MNDSDATPPERIEDLASEGLDVLDRGGDTALDAFLALHPAERKSVAEVISRARELGLMTPAAQQVRTGDHLGDFRLLEYLGGGGMGVVYAAEQTSLRRTVAVKVIRSDLLFLDSARARFSREVEAVASLLHPGIVRVLAVGDAQGVPYFAMERIDGRGTDAILLELAGAKPRQLTGSDWHRDARSHDPAAGNRSTPWWSACVELARQVAVAMSHAHGRGIVHRDLKPSNVMVTPDHRAIVIDFGLAHVDLATRLTLAGGEPGSPAYMSPEQLRGEPTDERTDIYSLGATLYEWLCLKSPFVGKSLGEVRNAVQRGDPERPRRHYPSLPVDVEVICLRAMDRDRDRRYPTMDAFAVDLAAVLARRPIAARPIGWGLRAWRWAQRNPALAGALGVALTIGLLLPLALFGQAVQASARLTVQRDRAERNLETSLAAMGRLLSTLNEAEFDAAPGAELMRLRMLEDAVALHRRLALDQPDARPLQRALGEVLHSFATALIRVGRSEEANTALREAIALLGGDDCAVATDWLHQRVLVRCLLVVSQRAVGALPDGDRQLAQLRAEELAVQQGGAAFADREAIAQIRQCLAVVATDPVEREALLTATEQLFASLQAEAAATAVTPHKREALTIALAHIRSTLALLQASTGRFEAALATCARGFDGLRAVATPARPSHLHLKARLLDIVGLSRRNLGMAHPELPLREAVDLLEQLHRDFRHSIEFAGTLDRVLHNYAGIIRPEHPTEARRALERSVTVVEGVLAASPKLLTAQQRLQNHLSLLLTWLHADRDFAAALPVAAKFGAMPGTGQRPYLGACNIGAAVNAILAQQPPPSANRLANWFDFGRAWLVSCWQRWRLAPWLDRAMALLLEAERRGWPEGTDLDAASLDLLRSRPQFQALRARVR